MAETMDRAEAWAALCALLHIVARDDYPPTDDVADVAPTLHAVKD